MNDLSVVLFKVVLAEANESFQAIDCIAAATSNLPETAMGHHATASFPGTTATTFTGSDDGGRMHQVTGSWQTVAGQDWKEASTVSLACGWAWRKAIDCTADDSLID